MLIALGTLIICVLVRPESSMQIHTEELDLKITDNGMPTGGFLLLTLFKTNFKVWITNFKRITYLYLYICWGVKVYIKSALKWQETVGLQMTNYDVGLELLECQSTWLTNFTAELSFKFSINLTASRSV